MKNLNDKRVISTEIKLKQALCSILLIKKINDVSIKELTTIADVNRVTFYQHYKSPIEFYEKTKNDFLKKIMSNVQTIQTLQLDDFIKIIIKTIMDDISYCKAIMGKHGDEQIIERILQLAKSIAINYWKQQNINLTNKQADYLYAFISGGLIRIIRQWLQGNLNLDIDDIVNMSKKMINDYQKLFI